MIFGLCLEEINILNRFKLTQHFIIFPLLDVNRAVTVIFFFKIYILKTCSDLVRCVELSLGSWKSGFGHQCPDEHPLMCLSGTACFSAELVDLKCSVQKEAGRSVFSVWTGYFDFMVKEHHYFVAFICIFFSSHCRERKQYLLAYPAHKHICVVYYFTNQNW